MDKAYSVSITFMRKDEATSVERFRCLVDRSMHGAITKAFRKSRSRKTEVRGHSNYGCERALVDVKFLGEVQK